MKAHFDSNGGSNASGSGGGVRDGKVHKAKHHHNSHHHHNQHKEVENAEIKAYLTKLQELVPFMPKNRKLSKLEVITHVIDYIRDLRQTLGLPPCNNDFDMESAAAMMSSPNNLNNSSVSYSPINPTISLNVINSASPATTSAVEQNNNSASLPINMHPHHPRQPLSVISNPNGNIHSPHEQQHHFR